MLYKKQQHKNIFVKVIPSAKKNNIAKQGNKFKVYVTAAAVKNKANKMAIKILAKVLNIKKGNLKIVKGDKSRKKIIEIINE